jgi:plastocyanin
MTQTPEKKTALRSRVVIIAAVFAALAVVAILVLLVVPRGGGAQVHEYVVPAGTQERIDAGEEISLFPQNLEVRVGDRLVIDNQDNTTHQVGPYVVGAGQRIEQAFAVPGKIEGFCTLHPSGQVSIIVR